MNLLHCCTILQPNLHNLNSPEITCHDFHALVFPSQRSDHFKKPFCKSFRKKLQGICTKVDIPAFHDQIECKQDQSLTSNVKKKERMDKENYY